MKELIDLIALLSLSYHPTLLSYHRPFCMEDG